jgi:hypothetical protein
VRESFGLKTKADRRRALQASAGSWKGRSFTGAEYVDALRGDLDERHFPLLAGLAPPY